MKFGDDENENQLTENSTKQTGDPPLLCIFSRINPGKLRKGKGKR